VLPLLFRVGPIAVYSWGVMLALAFVASWAVARWYLRGRGENGEIAIDLVLAAVIGGIVGARALYVATNWNEFAGHPLWIWMLQRGGMVFYGGLAGAVVTVAVYTFVRRLPVPLVADAAGVAVPLGIAIGRLGCFLNGCCCGVPTSAWFGVTFPTGAGPVVPAQLIDSVLNLAIFGGLVLVALTRRPVPGALWWGFLTMYSVSRFLIEFVRVNPAMAFGLSQAQLISVPLVLAGAIGLGVTLRRGRASEPGPVHGLRADGEVRP
jgi:phosphatidylglycerol---prolipoprotein diacylglyceryl transferase